MNDRAALDPYDGNILTRGLGPILTRPQVLRRLQYQPPPPGDMVGVPKEIRRHMLMAVRDLRWTPLEGVRIFETLDVMTRQSYRYRNPANAATWGLVTDEPLAARVPRPPAMAAIVVGLSGMGKTCSIERSFGCYPQQVVRHDTFPRLKGSHYQVVHLTAEVPPSGKLADLAANLMQAWDAAVALALPDEPGRFDVTLSKSREGPRMMDEWRRVAATHFLGCLHLDEVQNFFKIASLEGRRKKLNIKVRDANEYERALELSIIEDQALKTILTLANTSNFALVCSGTPDGVGALTKRLSNVQRFVASGYHRLSEFSGPEDGMFIEFMQVLGRYQYVVRKVPMDSELRAVVFKLTAGIPRIIIALWVAAHRVAFERKEDSLTLTDFTKAASTLLAPLAPAVAALLTRDPAMMRRYEDLMPRDDSFWQTFWSPAGAH